MEAKKRKKLTTALKILISGVLIYFIFTKIELKDVLNILKRTQPWYLAGALIFFVLSKIMAALRLNRYFHQLKVTLTEISNVKLYLMGMFYNLFLPGGIGGDAYKGYLIKKQFGTDTKKVISALVIDRLSGMLLLFAFACTIAFFLESNFFSTYKILIGLSIPVSILVFWLLNYKLFPYLFPVFWKSVGFSALVQLAQLVSLLCILKALHIEDHIPAYLFIFLISSIVSVLPLTLGGIGSREVTFFYGALWLGLDQNTSVSISMVFFLTTAVVSLFGIIYHFKKPQLITAQDNFKN